MTTAISVKSRLKYLAQKEGRNVQDLFTLYVLERTLYRLSVSQYADHFTLMDHIAAFEPDFADDVYRKSRWKGFLKTKHVQTDMTLEDVISRIRCLLDPLIEAIGSNRSFNYIWHSAEQEWK